MLFRSEKDENVKNGDKFVTLKKFDEILGLDLDSIPFKKDLTLSSEIKEILEKRRIARENKNWKLSDELRNKLKSFNLEVLDTEKGQEIVPSSD